MNPAEWCVKNNRTATVLFSLILVAGVLSYRTISRLEDPEFTLRTALITTAFPGASPSRVESLVTDKLEKKIREMAEVEEVLSQSKQGVSIITVNVYFRNKDLKPIWDRLRNKIEEARSELPDEAKAPVINDEFGDVFGIVVSLTGDDFTYRELKTAADRTRDELLKLDGVGKVEFHGVQHERIFVEFSNSRLAESGIDPFMLANLLQAENIISPSGQAKVGPESITLEATGMFELVDQVRQVSIRLPGRPDAVRLEDIADITRAYEDPPAPLTRFNGQRCITIAINMAKGGNIVDLGTAVRQRLAELTEDQPIGMEYEILAFQPKFVKRSIRNFMINLIEAVVFVIVVMFCFTGIRMGLIVGTLIPMAMLSTIALMPAMNTDLQKISIASLIIALGMLVDNGVVVSENILVRLAGGQERLKAVRSAVKELAIPLLAASATTICAFLPIPLANATVGEYCRTLFTVIAATLAASWVFSLTLIPMLCYFFLKPKLQKQTFSSRFYRGYRATLVWSLKHRFTFLGILLGLLVIAGIGFGYVPKIFFPPNDREMLIVDFWQPYGTDIRTTSQRVKRLEDYLLSKDSVSSVGSFVGNGGPRWYLSLTLEKQSPNYAFLIVNLDSEAYLENPRIADTLISDTAKYLDSEFPDTRHTIRKLENGPAVGAPVQIRISGPDTRQLFELRHRVEKEIENIPGLVNVRDDWGEWIKKLEIQVKQEQAKRAGFTSQDIAQSLQTQISGYQATEYREDNEIIPIILRSKQTYRDNLFAIESLNVYAYASGRSVPLMQVADTELVWQPANIRRRNQERTITIKGDLEGRLATDILAEAQPRLEALRQNPEWPSRYTIEYGGEQEESQKSQAAIGAVMPLAMGLLFLVLVAQFNSFRRTAIVGLTIPPMIIGITPGLLITHAAFGFMAMLGMISLIGIIVNNAIMLIDRIEIERDQGGELTTSIVLAAQRRLRPILCTAITTIIGLVPLSLQGGEFWRPMANTIMFGLAFATVLTLLLCPVLYSIFFRAQFKNFVWRQDLMASGPK